MDPQAFDHLQADPVLGPIVEAHGELSIEPANDPFRRLTVSIINQQLSSASAAAIRERVFERFDITPAGLVNADATRLRDAGLSTQKIDYIRNIATVHLDRDLGVEYFQGTSDEAVIDELTEIKGVGVWTAKMYLMFCLGREDVFPVEDLGIRKGMNELFDGDLDRPRMVDIARAWRPYRSYASRYLWRVSDD